MNTTLTTHPDTPIGAFRTGTRTSTSGHAATTTVGRATLENWIAHHPACTDAELRHLVASVTHACLALQRSTGRSHGALSAGRIVLGEAMPRRLTQAVVELAGPRAPETVDPDEVELGDLCAIGAIIVQLVEGRMVDAARTSARGLRMGEAWRGLGRQADFWFLLCHQLLDTGHSLAAMNLATLALEFPLRRRQPALVACALASCALALASAALYVTQPAGSREGSSLAQESMHEHAPAGAPVPSTESTRLNLDRHAGTVLAPSDAAGDKPPTSIPAATFVPIMIEAQPGSLASILDARGSFTSLGMVDPRGRLSRDLAIPAGTYELTLEHRSFATTRQPVDLRPGEAITVRANQAPMPGTLRITSFPAGAQVQIDGASAGTTPLTLHDQPSQHELTVTVSLAGHEPVVRTLTLEPREIRALDLGALIPQPARASSAPSAVSAAVDSAPRVEPVVVASIETPMPVAQEAIATTPVTHTDSVNSPADPVSPTKPFTGPRRERAWTVPQIGIEMQWIGPGRFLMGSPASEPGRRANEPYQTAVQVHEGFWIGRFEVSQAHYAAMMTQNPSAFSRARAAAPVEQVSWDDAMEFCRRLTARERRAGRLPAGYSYTLPTEAQWEYACRAGTSTPWPGTPELMAWFEKNARRQTRAPGEKLPVSDPFGTVDSGPSRFIPQFRAPRPNDWGLHDMIGNVAEWCRTSHELDTADVFAVIRGGGWQSSVHELRSACREETPRDTRRSDIGFRVVLAAE